MKPIIWWSIGIVVGLGFVVGALFGAVLPKPPAEVKCGSEVMTPANVCEEDDHGSKHTYSYDEMKSKNATDTVVGGWIGIAWGVGLGTLSVVKLTKAVRRRRAGGGVPAMAGAPQQWSQPVPPQYPPQQYPPQQHPPQQYPPQQYPPQQYPPQQQQPQQEYYPPQQQQPYQPPQNFGPQG